MAKDIFTSTVVPIMNKVRDDLSRKQAEEYGRHASSWGAMMAGAAGPDGGMAAMDAYNDTIYYIVHCLTAFLFTFYILEYTSFLSWKKWYNYVLLSAPAMIVSVLMLLNPIFHHFWSYVPIDGVYVYTRGDALWVVYALPIIYSIAGVVFFCLSTRTMQFYYRVAVLFLFSFTFVGITA